MSERRSAFGIVLKGVLLTCVLNILFILVYATILAYTDVAESTIPTVMFVINLVGIFICSKC